MASKTRSEKKKDPQDTKEPQDPKKGAGELQAELLLEATSVACGGANCSTTMNPAEAKAFSRNRLLSARSRLQGARRDLAHRLHKRDEGGPTPYCGECANALSQALGAGEDTVLEYAFVLAKFVERKTKERESAEKDRVERKAQESQSTEELAAQRKDAEKLAAKREAQAGALLEGLRSPEDLERQARRDQREALETSQRQWLARLTRGELTGGPSAETAEVVPVYLRKVDETTLFTCAVPECNNSGTMATLARSGKPLMHNVTVPLRLVKQDGSPVIDQRDDEQVVKSKPVALCSYHAWLASQTSPRKVTTDPVTKKEKEVPSLYSHPLARTFKRFLEREQADGRVVATASTEGPTRVFEECDDDGRTTRRRSHTNRRSKK